MRKRILIILSFILLMGCVDLFAQDGFIIHKIAFSGNDSLETQSLLMQMNTKPRTFTQKLKFWKKSEGFSLYSFDEDIIKLKKNYQKNGFLNPIISYNLLSNDKKERVNIKINIKENISVNVGKINYRLPYALESDVFIQRGMDSIENQVPININKRFKDEDVIATEKIIYDYFSKQGYPFIQESTNITLNKDKQTADLEFDIFPGNKSYIGEVKLDGDSLISTSYINNYIKIRENEIFTETKLQKTQEDIYDLGLFKYVTIRALMDSVENDKIPILIKVKELPRWSLQTGLGYGTEDKVRVSLLLKRLNFLGGGRTLILKGSHSYFIPLNIEAKFIQPNIFIKNMDLIVNPYFSREKEDSYDVDRLGTSVTLQKNFKKKSSAYISYTYGKDKVNVDSVDFTSDDVDIEDINSVKSGVTVGYNKSSTNDMFYPSKGWKYSGMATYMGLGLNSQFHYYKLLSEVDHFHKIGKKVVFASKLKGGIMHPTQGDASTPIEDRFLIGGSLSLRGWGRHQVSPINDEDTKVGGNSMLEGAMELRFPVFEIFSGVTFFDFGNVWSDSWGFDLGDLKYDAGLGLRVKTPVGPLRLDLATPIFDGKLSTQFFITIGHAF